MSIKAHGHHHLSASFPPEWKEARPPEGDGIRTARLRRCSFCGSMHPTDLAAAIASGATVHWADRKYGWPHKIYVERVPNPHAGLLEIRTGKFCGQPPQDEIDAGKWERYQDGFNERTGEPKFSYRILGPEVPAPALEHGKFYTEHLQDATPDERVVIERAMCLNFEFSEDGAVRWSHFAEVSPT